MHRRRTAPLAALALSLALALAACGGEDTEPTDAATTSTSPEPSASDSSSGSPSESASEPAEDGTRIEITREGDTFTPMGERVEAPVGEPVTLVITADTAGELHVHSTPEQEVAYEAGTSEHTVTIDRPGVVEVESHEPDVVVLQLEVR